MAIAIDTAVVANNSGGASFSVASTLTSISAGDVIFAQFNGGTGTNTIADTSLLTWHSIGITNGGQIQAWWAFSSGAIASTTITVTSTNFGSTTLSCYGLSGVNTSSPIDASSPLIVAPGAFTNTNTLTTTSSTTWLVAVIQDGLNTPTVGTGYTVLVPTATFQALGEYQSLSSAGSNVVTIGNSSGDYPFVQLLAWGVVAAGGAADVLMSQVWM